jgi:uncharacterized protein (UPF0210 family)
MNIRALTGFFDPGWPLDTDLMADLVACLQEAKTLLTDFGYTVQSLRLATPPPARMETPVAPGDRAKLAGQLEAECFLQGVDYASIGPALPSELEGYEVIPEVLAATGIVFACGLIADKEGGLSLPAAKACGSVIHTAATISEDGFANLRFAALANVLPGSPFFPAAYHAGGSPALALATEAADLAVEALREAESLPDVRRVLVNDIQDRAATLARNLQPVVNRHGVQFQGVDFSLAPYPESLRSLGTALESIGVPAAGMSGTAAAACFLADCLDRAVFPRTGFCGLFLPVMEDSVLAGRAAEGTLTITDLLLYATVCGTGLDTVPLPGDASPEALTAVLVDLGALALRHDKPLTARLMPIPGKAAGDKVHFDFQYFADSRVMQLPAQPLQGLLDGTGSLDVGPSPRQA